MPDGSSSAAPVISPGPSFAKKPWKRVEDGDAAGVVGLRVGIAREQQRTPNQNKFITTEDHRLPEACVDRLCVFVTSVVTWANLDLNVFNNQTQLSTDSQQFLDLR